MVTSTVSPTLIARAIDHLGSAEFYDRLLDVLGAAATHDLAALVCYSRTAPPDLIIPRIEPTPAMLAYYQHFYAYDPFYAHWARGGEIGVYRLRAMDKGIGRSRYAREFLTAMAIHDEIAVFLPPVGDSVQTLILDRAQGSFSVAEVGRVEQLFPLLSALQRKHAALLGEQPRPLVLAPLPPASALPIAMAHDLTDREQQVVLLTLQGYPVIGIAQKLGLSRGTVKNHRLAIYRKLDITTERELFGVYMAALRGQDMTKGTLNAKAG
jgi:DNA-binding CsgD family transcriptional regulator